MATANINTKIIPSSKFKNQKYITSVNFGSNCSSIGDNAFEGCISLSKINDNNSIQVIGNCAFINTILSSVKFNSVVSIGQYAFRKCTTLSNIYIQSCSTIQSGAFYECENLCTVNADSCKNIHNYAFFRCKNLYTVNAGSCKNIHSYAFCQCINLKNIIIRSNDIILQSCALLGCKSLEKFPFSKCLYIGSWAFSGCSSLTNANLTNCSGHTLYNSTLGIGEHAFDGCINLNEIMLSKCRGIGSHAFYGCVNLKSVYITDTYNGEYIPLGKSAFYNNYDDGSSDVVIKDITFYIDPNIYNIYYKNGEEEYDWKNYKDYMVTYLKDSTIKYSTNDNKSIISEIKKEDYTKYGIISDKEIVNTNFRLLKFNEGTTNLENKIFQGKKNLISIELSPIWESIGTKEFEGCTNLTSFTQQTNNGLTKIGDFAFKNSFSNENENRISFTIPETINNIGSGAFIGCKQIEKFVGGNEDYFTAYDGKAIINKTNKIINNKPTTDYKLICVLPDYTKNTEERFLDISKIFEKDNIKITSLGSHCFNTNYFNYELMRVDLPPTLLYIDNYTFYGLENIREINFLNNNVINFNNYNIIRKLNENLLKIFVKDNLFKEYYNKNNNYKNYIYPKTYETTNSKSIIYFVNKNLSNKNNENFSNTKFYNELLFENESVKCYKKSNPDINLLFENFKNKKSIVKIILGDGITVIPENSFADCINLEYIYIPNSVRSIKNGAFSRCKNLLNIHIPYNISNNTTITFGDGKIFDGCSNLKEFISYYDKFVSSDGRCYIDESNALKFFAYGGMKEKEEYELHVKKIHKYAFFGADLSSIGSIKLLNNELEEIGESAFEGSNLLKITGLNIETISKNTFKDCTNLKDISLPQKVTTIGESAFEGCSGLLSIHLNKISTISKNSFKNCTNLSSISLPSTLTTIGESAFEGCKSMFLYSINDEYKFPTNITEIGARAFMNCDNFICKKRTNISFEDYKYENVNYLNLENIKINEETFKNCTSLSNKIKIKNKNSIGESAFEGCTSLSSVEYSTSADGGEIFDAYNNRINISKKAFKNCTNLSSISLPSNLETICDKSFYGCNNLTNITLPETPTMSITIGNNAFEGCSNLVSISNCKNIKTISDFAFKNCTNLKSISLPSNSKLTKIGNSAFYGCSGLLSISLPSDSKLTTIGNSAFYGCSGLSSISLPSTLTTIGNSAFEKCSKLSGSLTFPSSIKTIGEYCFAYTNIESIFNYMNFELTEIPYRAFYNCKKLDYIDISNIISVRDEAFLNAPIEIINLRNTTYLGDRCFEIENITENNTIEEIKIYVYMDVPPAFTSKVINGYRTNKNANPFGKPNEKLKIFVYKDAYTTYTKNEYWEKYTDCIYAEIVSH